MENKEQLQKLIAFISSVAKQQGNEWFVEELAMELGVATANPEIKEMLMRIETYLKIDGVQLIDYSKIRDEKTQMQLTRDCIEMSRYRLGKINNTINFGEFCRYAHMQAEELINYFLNMKFPKNIKEIIVFVEDNTKIPDKENSGYKRKGNEKSVTYIDYNYKLTAFCNNVNFKNKPTLEFINKLRNELSHRSSLDDKDDDEVLIKLREKGIDIFAFHELMDMSVEDKALLFKGKNIVKVRKENFNEIIDVLNELKNVIISELKKFPFYTN